MQRVRSLPWAVIGNSLQAALPLDFGIDTDWRIYLGGNIGADFYAALSVDVDGQQLAPGVTLTASLNQVSYNVASGAFRTYTIPPYQRYLTVQASAGAPNEAVLTFYPYARPEWR